MLAEEATPCGEEIRGESFPPKVLAKGERGTAGPRLVFPFSRPLRQEARKRVLLSVLRLGREAASSGRRMTTWMSW